ncbi:hypothetical protein [Gracilimonas sediminicola]|uniref:hypothetical protein n=1 Tax=Gracilimonas sediminicola TaxID=2952158 RepID=UPI0038D3F135
MQAGRISTFLDGGVPGGQASAVLPDVEDTSYEQPDIQVIEMGEGEQPTAKKLCQRLQEQPISLSQWIRDNQNTLLIAGGLYAGYRLLRR